MQDQYIISDIKQMKALSHAARVKILSVLTEKPMTAKQLADHFGEEPAKTSYHVKQLLKVGLVELVSTRETQNGIIEKYYRAVAREFQTDPYLARQPEGRTPIEAGFLRALNRTQSEFLRAYQDAAEGDAHGGLAYAFEGLRLDSEQAAQFERELRGLVQRHAAGSPGIEAPGANYTFHFVLYPRTPAESN